MKRLKGRALPEGNCIIVVLPEAEKMTVEKLDTVMSEVERELDERDELREIALKRCREIVRLSSDLIYRMQKGAASREVVDGFRNLKSVVMELNTLLTGNYEVYYSGFVEEALQEYVEATLLRCAVSGKDLPTPAQLKVDASTYVLGLSDLIGEFRRIALNSMIEGRVEEAAHWVNEMERLFVAISRLHYPSKLVHIRKKQDTARAMLDRTRGELATTMASHALRK